MKCPKCGNEFDGKFCPECGTPVSNDVQQNQVPSQPDYSTPAAPPMQSTPPVQVPKKRRGCLIAFLIVLAVVVIIVIAAIAGSGSNDPQKVGDLNSNIASQNSISTEGTSSVQSTFKVGEKVEINGVVVTLLSAEESKGNDFNKPDDGKTFMICEFEIENGSSKDIAISSIMSFEAYVDGYSTTIDLSAQISTDKDQLDGSVAAGKKMKGVIGYQIPKDWKELEINVTPDFWGGKDITFVVNK